MFSLFACTYGPVTPYNATPALWYKCTKLCNLVKVSLHSSFPLTLKEHCCCMRSIAHFPKALAIF